VTATVTRVRTRARIEGTVQGVGFRPFVYRLATGAGLAGYVLNDERGVLLEVEGEAESVDCFVRRLTAETPPLAVIESITCEAVSARDQRGFAIVESERSGAPEAPVTPDSATCVDCRAELFSPSDRRYRYPFINCTNCGPRFTIVRGVPYDRPLTTMAPFAMCTDCRGEYEDPGDRRFHAQPNACPRCGPALRLLDRYGETLATADPLRFTGARLREGFVVAVKGLGGFHLACNAADERAVAALRRRKHREDKPFALMVADAEAARAFVELGAEERQLLESVQRPIVLAPRVAGAPVAAAVAPGTPELGLMLPYTPLHHLLVSDFGAGALVMTSGNVSDEPIAFRDEDALQRLAPIADLFVTHDREIETRTDDSVIRVVRAGADRRRPLPLRRSRGYTPAPLPIAPVIDAGLLACGAEQKSTFCVAKGARAWVSHHVGDLEHVATHEAFRDGITHFERLFAVVPEVVAHDLHPDYLSTTYALTRDGVQHVGVQHHHAHLAACLAEHGMWESDAVGAIFDGTGYGTDGTVWGGELLVGGVADFERAGWLWPVRMPGSAAAIRQPWRMAFAWLAESFGEPQPPSPALERLVAPARWYAMAQVAASPAVSPLTSSIGRLFDAVGSLCGIGAEVSYEGQAAVELEAAAWAARAGGSCEAGAPASPARAGGSYELELGDGWVLDPRAAIRAIYSDLALGLDRRVVSARFHDAVARATVAAVTGLASERSLETAVLSGGVFQNRLLLELVAAGLERAGLRVLIPERLPPNDGGISYGQAAVVAASGQAAAAAASGSERSR
jgi:hydrogenase maturation protein HypF